jgi:hypothetical protein
LDTNHYKEKIYYIIVEQKIQAYTEDYTKYVVQKLKRIKGKSESDVVNFIIKDWIGEHWEELKEYGINIKNAKKEKKL